MALNQEVILVDQDNIKKGSMEKLEAHIKGKLHRAYSILIFNYKDELLIQKRSKNKYHSSGLWANSICSHPYNEESLENAVKNGLKRELGIEAEITKIFDFVYKTHVGELIEHEFDHVFIGFYNEKILFNTNEIEMIKWQKLDHIKDQIKKEPEIFSKWFDILINNHLEKIKQALVKLK